MSSGSRRVLGVLLVVILCALPIPAHAAPTTVWADCVPGPSDCDGWYRGPVTVKWHAPNATEVAPGTCVPAQTLYADTAGTELPCIAWQGSEDSGRTVAQVVIKIDSKPPVLLSATPGRPPDFGGWFNHPVALSFHATDATSGVHSCSTVTYSGPYGAGVPVAGRCRDMAGNVAGRSFPLNYDSKPPRPPAVRGMPGNHRVALEWSRSTGTTAYVVRVSPAHARHLVYHGSGHAYTDRSLRNERRYRYVVTLVDQAGNRAAGRASAVPTASPLLLPAQRARLRRPPLFLWKEVRRASYYNVQIIRSGRKILSRWPRDTRLQLHSRWRYGGRLRRLVAGRYCWYVWPGFGVRSERRYGQLLGRRCFTVSR
jgi:hypothetical protein